MNRKLQLKALAFMCGWMMLQQNAQAQLDFRDGYIIKHESDTVFGLVNFHDGSRSSEVCQFKGSANAESTRYSPEDISGYGFVKSRKYLSKSIPDKDGTKKMFMEVIAYGRIVLLRHSDDFWAAKEGGELLRLRDDIVRRTYNADTHEGNSKYHGTYDVHSREYVGVLNIMMADCSDVQPYIQKTQLHQRELVKLVESYNNCGHKDAVKSQVDAPWLKVIPGIIGVGQFSSVDVSDLAYVFGDELEQMEKEVSPIIGITVDFFSPRISERFLFNTSVWYTPSTYYLRGVKQSARHYALIDVDEIKIPLGIRYTLAPRAVTPYVNVGFSSTFAIRQESHLMLETISGNIVNTYDKGELPLKEMSFGYWGGVGLLVRLGKTMDSSIEFRYERTDGLVDTSLLREFSSHVTNLQLLIALRLNRAQ